MAKAVLVNVGAERDLEAPLKELELLAETAGFETAAIMTQKKQSPDKATYIGKGKLDELKNVVEATESEIVIFDNDITGSQNHNLETYLGVEVIDRATLILRIFSAHAVTNEGKLQIKLAEKKHELPRIIGKGIAMSRQGGGGAGGGGARRGGGEQKLELDKRALKREIRELEDKIEKLTEERALRRAKREKNEIKTIAIVGYTNAGKSTLMNALTNAGVKEEDKLFATLDPVGRKIYLGENVNALIVDTVGFISRLPHEFISAFRSTLEETKYADVILHVADGTNPDMLKQFDVVNEVLESLGITEIPIVVALNKCDLGEITIYPAAENVIAVSAKRGDNLNALRELLRAKLQ